MTAQTTLTLPTGDKIRYASKARYAVIVKHGDDKPFVAGRHTDDALAETHFAALGADWPAARRFLVDAVTREVLWDSATAPVVLTSACLDPDCQHGISARCADAAPAVDETPDVETIGRAVGAALSSPEVLAKVQARMDARAATVTPEAPVIVPEVPAAPVVPETPAAEPETAPAEDVVKIRVGRGLLAYLMGTAGVLPALADNARTARRYKDGCSVLVLTRAEAVVLREVAETVLADLNAPGAKGVAAPAKAVVRWMDQAGVTLAA